MNYELKMLRNLKALYKYTDKFLAIFSLVDASSRLDRKRLGNFVGKRESQTDRDRDRERQRQTETETETQRDRETERQRQREGTTARATTTQRVVQLSASHQNHTPSFIHKLKRQH